MGHGLGCITHVHQSVISFASLLLDGLRGGALPEAVPEPPPDDRQVAHAAGAGGLAPAGLHGPEKKRIVELGQENNTKSTLVDFKMYSYSVGQVLVLR